MPKSIIPYNPELKERAKYLRTHMTLAEILLWKRLSRKQICGYDFDRQRPIGEYIVDFYCRELNLALEVDGASHDFKQGKDARRQQVIERMGVNVLRFWDSEVRHDMEAVIGKILAWIEEYKKACRGPQGQ